MINRDCHTNGSDLLPLDLLDKARHVMRRYCSSVQRGRYECAGIRLRFPTFRSPTSGTVELIENAARNQFGFAAPNAFGLFAFSGGNTRSRLPPARPRTGRPSQDPRSAAVSLRRRDRKWAKYSSGTVLSPKVSSAGSWVQSEHIYVSTIKNFRQPRIILRTNQYQLEGESAL